MKYSANSVEEYLEQVADDKKEAINQIRNIILRNIPNGFKEELSYGMIGYVVPHNLYPSGYHCDPKLPLPFISLAAQKNFISLYHMGMYTDSELVNWFTIEFPKHSKYKLDMGKCCIRLKKTDGIPYDLIKELVQKTSVSEYIQTYETLIKKS